MSLHSASRALQRTCLRQSSVAHPCRQQLRHLSSRPSAAFSPLLRTQSHLLPTFQSQPRRRESTARPLTDRPDHLPKPEPREEVPSYEMTFTCKACTTRSSHRMSKQGYHHGTILITCPGCKNRHLIADHLKVCETRLSHLMRQMLTCLDLLRQAYYPGGHPRTKGPVAQEGCFRLRERYGVLGRRHSDRTYQEALNLNERLKQCSWSALLKRHTSARPRHNTSQLRLASPTSIVDAFSGKPLDIDNHV